MRMRAFRPAVHGFLETLRDGHPETPIMVISPISCPEVEARPGPAGVDPSTGKVASLAVDPVAEDALTLSTIRDVLTAIVEERRRTDPHLT